MGFEILSRLAPRTGHTEVMAWSNITGVRIDGELIDFESTLRVGVPGGKIESTGRSDQRVRQKGGHHFAGPERVPVFQQEREDVRP